MSKKVVLVFLFEMLIILQRTIVAAPSEAVLLEETVCKVVTVNLVFECLGAVSILSALFGADLIRAVLAALYVGIVERIDVNGFAETVVGKLLRSCYGAVVEASGVVMLHRPYVVSSVIVD